MKDNTRLKPWEAISLILTGMAAQAVPGKKTIDIDMWAEKRIKELGATSVNKGYKQQTSKSPWPFVSCINVNDVIAHGYPSDYELQEGDIVSFDLGIKIGNQCADAALTVGVGEISNQRRQLLTWAKRVLYEAISYMQPGADTQDIAQVIETFCLRHGFFVNRRFGGHRIAEEMHMKPNIYNTVESIHTYGKLKVGEIYCIEPMITRSRDNLGICTDPNLWCYKTADGKDSAFFEHMVLITNSGPKVLTTHISPDKI
jgi:methionyl aminopeptidase